MPGKSIWTDPAANHMLREFMFTTLLVFLHAPVGWPPTESWTALLMSTCLKFLSPQQPTCHWLYRMARWSYHKLWQRQILHLAIVAKDPMCIRASAVFVGGQIDMFLVAVHLGINLEPVLHHLRQYTAHPASKTARLLNGSGRRGTMQAVTVKKCVRLRPKAIEEQWPMLPTSTLWKSFRFSGSPVSLTQALHCQEVMPVRLT